MFSLLKRRVQNQPNDYEIVVQVLNPSVPSNNHWMRAFVVKQPLCLSGIGKQQVVRSDGKFTPWESVHASVAKLFHDLEKIEPIMGVILEPKYLFVSIDSRRSWSDVELYVASAISQHLDWAHFTLKYYVTRI